MKPPMRRNQPGRKCKAPAPIQLALVNVRARDVEPAHAMWVTYVTASCAKLCPSHTKNDHGPVFAWVDLPHCPFSTGATAVVLLRGLTDFTTPLPQLTACHPSSQRTSGTRP